MPEPEQAFFDDFVDNSSGWFETDTPGLRATVNLELGTYTWIVEPAPDLDPLPFEAQAEAVLSVPGLDDIDVSVECRSSRTGWQA